MLIFVVISVKVYIPESKCYSDVNTGSGLINIVFSLYLLITKVGLYFYECKVEYHYMRSVDRMGGRNREGRLSVRPLVQICSHLDYIP